MQRGIDKEGSTGGGSMRLLSILSLLAVCFVCSPGSDGQKPMAGQPDISRSGSNFLEICSSIDSEGNRSSVRIYSDAMCLGWVEGFADGFTVHDELLSVPEKDRMVCMPRGVTTIQIVRIIKKYIADNPEKAHRPTRYITSLALARAFPCKAGR
jgi:hypothetical protein